MTKEVRIENADTSDHKVVVQTWQRAHGGAPDVLVREGRLDGPCWMDTYLIHRDQYLIVKEAED